MARYGRGYADFGGYGWRPYVPVAQRRLQAAREMDALRKKGVDIQPVVIEGRKIATTFWGKAWCDHLESFSDYENRLPRGRTYVRNGSVCHLDLSKGKVAAKVCGSEMYNVEIGIKPLPAAKWKAIKARCGGQIGSLLELLQGRLSDHVMEVVTDRKEGLFPLPGEITMRCSCPDWATMCKHVAAVLYGVGARLDTRPELLFVLRGVDHEELIEADAEQALSAATSRGGSQRLEADALGDVFGIELDSQSTDAPPAKKAAARGRKKTAKASATKKSARSRAASATADAAPAAPKRKKATPAAGGKKKAAKKTAKKAAKKTAKATAVRRTKKAKKAAGD